MRIVIVINSFRRGGAEKSTAAFMMYLKNKFKDCEIIGVYFDKHTNGEYLNLEENNILLHHIPHDGYIRNFFALRKLLKTLNPDIVHSVLFQANILARMVSITAKFYLVESLVNRSYASNREFRNNNLKFKNNVVKWIDKNTFFLVDHFHSVSVAVQDHYESVYGKKLSCTVIHRARKPAPMQKKSYELGSQIKLFTIARQEHQKGLIYLFEAIKNSPHNLCLKIAGREGNATQELLAYIKSNHLEDKIQFVGFRDDLQSFFMDADAYISGSFFEGSPGSVIEAMSYGLPLILSDIPEHREIAKKDLNAIFFQLKNTAEIMSIFEGIFDKKISLEILGKNSLQIFSASFVEDVVYAEFGLMYKRLYQNFKANSK